MVRRSTPQRITDDGAFPIRLLVVVPGHGLGRTEPDLFDWLRLEIGLSECANHSAGSTAGRSTAAFYFRRIEDAARFLSTFPHLQLADGTTGPTYTSPYLPFGRK